MRPGWYARSRARQPAAYGIPFLLFAPLCHGRFPQSGHTGDYTIVLLEWTADDHSLGCDLVQPELMAMLAPAHFDNGHHSQELSFQLDIPLDDDLIGYEGHLLGGEARLRECLRDFRGHEYRYARCRKR